MPSPAQPEASDSARRAGVLFTAFEPSGDDHASAVIAELRERHPDLPIHAWGGPRMEAAGATIVERTGDDAVMGMPGIEKIREHQRINKRIESWLDDHAIRVHVPVDSPAANFPICAISKKRGIKVVHLVAPQIWAWGPWRIGKLRRLTDLVLCLLPFEEGWFTTRGVPARFIGHPLFDERPSDESLEAAAVGFPEGTPRLALMPGSRPSEWHKNFPLLLEVFDALAATRPEAVGIIAATNEHAREQLQAIGDAHGGISEQLTFVVGKTDPVVHWCDLALVVSGTVTLQIARQARPMIAVYRSSRWLYELIGRWIVSTRFFTLPNLIAGREVLPEFVPHFGGSAPIVAAAARLLDDPEAMEQQKRELTHVVSRFDGRCASSAAADAIEDELGLT